MNGIYLIVTSVTVSLDSFIAGFSLSLNTKKGLSLPLCVAFATFLLCFAACIAGELMKGFLQNYVKYFGAAILACLGLGSLVKQEDPTLQRASLSQCLSIGFGVGLDGAAAALSLTIQGVGNTLVTPLLFSFTHFAAVFLGQRLAMRVPQKGTNVFSATVFFVLAAAKLAFD